MIGRAQTSIGTSTRRATARASLIGSAVLATLAVTAGIALATPQTSFNASFSKTAVNTPTTFSFTMPEEAGNTQPARLVRITATLPKGSAIDQGAAARCGASDDDFAKRGASACSNRARVGSGQLTLRPPTPGAADEPANVTAFNGSKNRLLLYVKPTTAAAPFVLRTAINGTPGKTQQLVTAFPVICAFGVPNGGQPFCGVDEGGKAAGDHRVAAFDVDFGRKTLIRTPRSCPASQWTFRAQFDYADATSAKLSTSGSCVK